MNDTLTFRRKIRAAMVATGATVGHTYTDTFRVGTNSANDARRRVCFYDVRVPRDGLATLYNLVTEAGGYCVGIYGPTALQSVIGKAGTVCLNIRAVCKISNTRG